MSSSEIIRSLPCNTTTDSKSLLLLELDLIFMTSVHILCMKIGIYY